MGGGEEVKVQVDKDWEENLRYLGLVGVAFVLSKAQKSGKATDHISSVKMTTLI